MTVRAVPDTNVVIAASKAENPGSPNREILDRWLNGEFVWVYSIGTLDEYAEKLLELGVAPTWIEQFLTGVAALGELVEIASFHFREYPSDPDDVPFFLCAVNGQATHLITYDSDFDPIRGKHETLKICTPIEFLDELRSLGAVLGSAE